MFLVPQAAPQAVVRPKSPGKIGLKSYPVRMWFSSRSGKKNKGNGKSINDGFTEDNCTLLALFINLV